jgi:hypothetical protein
MNSPYESTQVCPSRQTIGITCNLPPPEITTKQIASKFKHDLKDVKRASKRTIKSSVSSLSESTNSHIARLFISFLKL